MNIAILCSNYANIDRHTKKGTEIFSLLFIRGLVTHASDLTITTFASGASDIPTNKESIAHEPSVNDPAIIEHGKHIMYELALLSKAFTMQDRFDLYHVHIGDDDLVMPFVPFVKKPILITLHHIYDADHTRKYFDLFSNYPNVFFVSASNAQRNLLPDLNYIATIHHGIDEENFPFHPDGSETMMWAGRAIPEKGLDQTINIAEKTAHPIKLFAISKKETQTWFSQAVLPLVEAAKRKTDIRLELDRERLALVPHFQTSKLFLYPVGQEEAFGLVLVEAMACGTPVVAFARGSIPEIIKDGETGFIVNSSEDDIRGNWIIKKTGEEGLREAVERIYAMPEAEYKNMRQACRTHIEKHFTVRRMVQAYEEVYKKIIK